MRFVPDVVVLVVVGLVVARRRRSVAESRRGSAQTWAAGVEARFDRVPRGRRWFRGRGL